MRETFEFLFLLNIQSDFRLLLIELGPEVEANLALRFLSEAQAILPWLVVYVYLYVQAYQIIKMSIKTIELVVKYNSSLVRAIKSWKVKAIFHS